MLDQDVLVIVPTHNRCSFIRRLLLYYVQVYLPFRILVIDSSDDEIAGQVKRATGRVADRLNIEWHRDKSEPADKIIHGLANSRASFCVINADDDFLFPDGALVSADFLNQFSEYTVALGATSYISADVRDTSRRHLGRRSVEFDDPLVRLKDHMENFHSNYYGVHRTEVLLRHFRVMQANVDSVGTGNMGEYLLGYLTAVDGKLKCFDYPYMLRQAHSDAMSQSVWRNIDHSSRARFVSRFRACLAEEVHQATGLSCFDLVEQFEAMAGIRDAEIFFEPALAQGRNWKLDYETPVPWGSLSFRIAYQLLSRYPRGVGEVDFEHALRKSE